MTYLICSDIHGALDSVKFILDKYKEYNANGIICLGDVLYHGPRNDIPNDYNPKEVIKLLTSYINKIIFIKGNCDAEVDEMVLNAKMFNKLDININGLNVHLEHGHHLDTYNGDANVILYGHTHISIVENKNNQVFINPGSISIPKNNTNRSIIIWENNSLKLLNMDNTSSIIYNY